MIDGLGFRDLFSEVRKEFMQPHDCIQEKSKQEEEAELKSKLEAYFKASRVEMCRLDFPESFEKHISTIIPFFRQGVQNKIKWMQDLVEKANYWYFTHFDFLFELTFCLERKRANDFNTFSDDGIDSLRRTLEVARGRVDDERFQSFKLLENAFKRLDQLNLADFSEFENPAPSQAELFRMAFFMEANSQAPLTPCKRYVSKKESLIGRSFAFDYRECAVDVSARAHLSTLKRGGAFKFSLNTLKICLNDYSSKPVVRAAVVFRKKVVTAKTQNRFEEEVALLKMFAYEPHIVQLENVFESEIVTPIEDLVQPEVLKRYHLRFRKFEYTGNDLYLNTRLIPFIEKLQLFKDFIEGLFSLHKKNYLHRDLKEQNFVFTKKGLKNVGILGALCDLGSAALCQNGTPLLENSRADSYNFGFYQAYDLTAPELFLVQNFQGNHFQVEVFAAGYTLYRMHYGKRFIEWEELFIKVYKCLHRAAGKFIGSYSAKTTWQEAQNQFRELVQRDIDENAHFFILSEKKRLGKALSQKEELEHLIFSMMLANPEVRIQLRDARLKLRKILISYPPTSREDRLSAKLSSLSL